jgi:hypothetical protein
VDLSGTQDQSIPAQEARDIPQGLKPKFLSDSCGTTEQLGEKLILRADFKKTRRLHNALGTIGKMRVMVFYQKI